MESQTVPPAPPLHPHGSKKVHWRGKQLSWVCCKSKKGMDWLASTWWEWLAASPSGSAQPRRYCTALLAHVLVQLHALGVSSRHIVDVAGCLCKDGGQQGLFVHAGRRQAVVIGLGSIEVFRGKAARQKQLPLLFVLVRVLFSGCCCNTPEDQVRHSGPQSYFHCCFMYKECYFATSFILMYYFFLLFQVCIQIYLKDALKMSRSLLQLGRTSSRIKTFVSLEDLLMLS